MTKSMKKKKNEKTHRSKQYSTKTFEIKTSENGKGITENKQINKKYV